MNLKKLPLSSVKKGTRILMRVDLNVPIHRGKISQSALPRLRSVAPEIIELTKRGARVILATHLGRPDGRKVTSLSTHHLARPLASLVGQGILTSHDIAGADAGKVSRTMQPGRIFLTENLRFDSREEKNKRSFAKELSLLGDIYVNNAFSVCHRKHASVCSITKYLTSYAGELLREEVAQLEKFLPHPFVLVLGGTKLETKMGFLQALGKQADSIVIGGGIGVVLEAIRSDRLELASHLKPTAQELRAGKKILRSLSSKLVLPSDVILKSDGKALNVHELSRGDVIVDIGPKSQRAFQKIIASSASAVWNGPMGVLEDSRARLGTQAILRALVHAKGRTIAGGGDTLQMLSDTGLGKKLSFVSTGGGAMLAFLAGEPMPGLKPLKRK